ncbi:2-dehydro-3-deoxygalactonokinase [Caulobacter sp.]|uniref:2-dehydro-3-deoxygalactonokinase n=1 Tax=Caulobacter sp. TaxID=78 RepID=UPI001622E4FD
MRDLVVFGDWGTSRLRLSLFDGGAKLAETDGPGIGALIASPAGTLLQALAPWRAEHDLKRVILCGMAGSRSGVIEAPYADCPADVTDWAGQAADLSLDGLSINVAPGLAATAANGAPDVMRGEETQIFGALALRPDLAQGEHWFVLPGTHSKWAHVRDGRVLGFQTFLTGELFALLTERSSLLMGTDRMENAADSAQGFDDGLARAREERPIGALFEARSAQLRAGRSGAWAQGYLSGLLLGSEVAEAVRSSGARAVTVIGAASLAERYGAALDAASVTSQALSGEACVLAGLRLFAASRS